MTIAIQSPPLAGRTVADLWSQLDEVPLYRILLDPPPGTATELDQKRLVEDQKVLCELVFRTLVIKPMSLYESVVAVFLAQMMGPYMAQHKPGILSGADGPFKLARGIIRLPDMCFVSFSQIPDPARWAKYIDQLHPDLAIEIISPGNTPKEMNRKLREYFDAGAGLVWYIDPASRTAVIWRGIGDSTVLTDAEYLDGAHLLPGLHLSLKELFDHAGPPPADFK